ncbi:MAG: tRNA (N(6)-L-threonylcarbamoyladenosine(37)-C(2))-methylthiotransferase MtaB [Cycloclasticus sp. symbiont of Poecilosclerida sp. M]|nr:MAG: tRNA (N(6)-L-threonylcarbamoyladenosine(37)-C(2))-methylthiotransferase MtaB [Cycloclasticus sp. symbiont of Poecilosclerida sp. M]
MRVHFKTLGCRLNEAETESWANDFQRQGHQVVDDKQTPDVLVINTCVVTAGAVRKSRQLIRKAHSHNPKAKLVVSGCYATLNKAETEGIEGVDLLINNQQKDKLVELTLQNIDTSIMPALSTQSGENTLFSRGRQRAFIKVQDGCRYRCSFCIVTKARGDEKSRKIKEIVNEVNAIHASGISEIIISGVHLGGYGSDIDSNLHQLVSALLEHTDMPRIRMGSLEPWDLPENFFQLFTNKRLMPHMHLPIQSGSNTVLRRMARRCKTEEFRSLVQQARAEITGLNVTSDIIVGFPGETKDEWQQTLDFVEEMNFGDLHIFSYSKREGTKAATLPGQVDETTKKSRSKTLHALASELKLHTLKALIGSEQSILWEGKKKNAQDSYEAFGYTPNYHRVKTPIKKDALLSNTITHSKIKSLDGSMLAI